MTADYNFQHTLHLFRMLLWNSGIYDIAAFLDWAWRLN